MKPRHALFAFLGILTLLRLVTISQMELIPDESYYYLWSQHPDLSYYSKGPGVAMAIRASTALFGATEFGVRFFSPLLSLGTSLLLFFLGRRLYGEAVGIWTALAVNVIPIFQAGGLLMTIDPLSIFLWAAALCACWLALERRKHFTWYWPLTGLFIGLGFLAKYTNAMQVLSIALLLAATPRYRREFARPGFYTMLALFALCTVPVFVWNSRHAWITLLHLRARGNLDSHFAIHPGEPLLFLGAHAVVYSPFIFIGMLFALWRALTGRIHLKSRFLLFFSVPLLLLYAVLALKKAGEPNWTAPAFLGLGILTVAFWHEKARQAPWAARLAVVALATGIVMSLVIINPDLLRKAGVAIPYAWDPVSRARGWNTSALAVEQARQKFEAATGKPVFLIGNKYQTSASLSFYLPDKRVEGPGHPPVYIPESQDFENQFSFWPRYDEFVPPPPGTKADAYDTEEPAVNLFVGRDALYITDKPNESADTAIKSGFERVDIFAIYEISRRGLPLRTLSVFACHHYRTLSL
jgi:hypothetical protein